MPQKDVNCSVSVAGMCPPHSLHCHVLSRRFNASFTAPQSEHFTRRIPLVMHTTLTPFFAAMYFNFAMKFGPKSLTLRPQSASSCLLRLKSESRSYSSVNRCAFQWKASRWLAILRCFRAKSSRARSRFFDLFFFRECLAIGFLDNVLTLFEKQRGFYHHVRDE